MSVLMTWSYMRIRHQILFWYRYWRLVLDWTVVVYIVLPAVAFAIYESRRYYSGVVLTGVTPTTPVLGPVTLLALLQVVTFLLVLVIHFSTFGKLAFPVQDGDRTFVLLAPLLRSRWFAVLWAEAVLAQAVYIAILTLLAWPLLVHADISRTLWIGQFALFIVYISSARILGMLIQQGEGQGIKDWICLQGVRVLLLIPPLVTIPGGLGHAAPIRFGVLTAATLLVTIIVWWLQRRVSWDPLYRTAASRMLERFSAAGSEEQRPVYTMKAPSGLLADGLDKLSMRVRERPLHPVVWLFLVRIMRKRGVFWDYLRISVGGVVAMQLVPVVWIRLLAGGFFLFLFYQYWQASIADLYRVPAKEQVVVSPITLQLAGARLLAAAMVVTACLWLVFALL